MTVSSDEFRCDPSYVFRPDDTGWARGVIAPELRLEPGDPRFKTGYLISPGLVVFRVVTVANGPDSVIVEHEEGSHYCQFEDGYGFKNLPREYDGDGGFDLFHPGMLKHVADYDGEHWTGEWSGFFQPVLNTAEKKQLDAECEVRLRGSGPVEWGADRAVVTYSGRVCGHALTLDIDVTAGGRAGGTPGTGVRAPLRLALKVRTIERTPVEGET
ncbi:MAG: hypothetical protein F4107_12975 [Gemmatimonadetes bacterium]|nr:hypothetical protein [Gemmatimonadota bacterium]MYD14346.1 hypothetical protein [Gemmatimonadota bacterium]MYI66827.1 hypothetical protein [Gemmatimonadota bacterium]